MQNIKKLLETITELPSSSFGDRPYIEMEGDNALKLDGCMEILSYDDSEASFRTVESTVTVRGRELQLCSYGNSTVRVTGTILGIDIERSNKKC